MLDFLYNFGAYMAVLVLFVGAGISYYFLRQFIGDETSIILGLILSIYPAFLVYRKIG